MIDSLMMRNKVLVFAVVAFAVYTGPALSSWELAQATSPSAKQSAVKLQPPPRSVIQMLRSFLGVNPPVAVGGSRSGGGQSICLLSPWPGIPVGVSTPVLEAVGPLNELRLERGGVVLWQQRASSTQPIEGPIPWPIKPLEPGEQLTLKIRPRGASGGDFAAFPLRAADAKVLAENQRQIQLLGNDRNSWFRYIEQLKPWQEAAAASLLSSPQAPTGLVQSLQCTER